MLINPNSSLPIYTQIANIIKDQIIACDYEMDEQVPSTNQLAKLLDINPATARKGLSVLLDEEILYKKRGLGMFVCKEARGIIMKEKKSRFYSDYIENMIIEANKIGLTKDDLIKMIKK